MKLLLFDIDGTLLHVNGVGRKAVAEALSTLTNHPVSIDGVSFSGRTDPAIFEAALLKNDLPATQETIERALEAYVDTMQNSLSSKDVEVLPGVRPLLSQLESRPDVQLGLLTGNVEPAAYEKLSVPSLAGYFPFGAFGSDHADRTQLPSIATRRATDHTGYSFRFDDQVVIIGDTVHDIQCARAVGAQAVAVCTGRYTRDDLTKQAPEVLLDSLRDTNNVLERVVSR